MRIRSGLLLVLVLGSLGSMGCKNRRQRKECRLEVKGGIEKIEKALSEKLQKDYVFCDSAKNVPAEIPKAAVAPVDGKLWEDPGWKCIGFSLASTYCQWSYQADNTTDPMAPVATLTVSCEPADDGKVLKWERKWKGNLTGDAERVTTVDPPE